MKKCILIIWLAFTTFSQTFSQQFGLETKLATIKSEIDLINSQKQESLYNPQNNWLAQNRLFTQDSLIVDQEIRLALEKFASQRDKGKIMELIGALGIGVTSYLASRDNVKVPAIIPGLLIGVMLGGFIIDIDAVNHLRRNKKRGR